MFPNKIMIAVGLALAMVIGAYFYGYKAGGDSQRAADAEKVQEAVDAARKEEQVKQEKVNEQAQKQFDDLSDINNTLNADNLRLQQRPNRKHLPNDSKVNCQGTTGANLSRPDARFLTREAARADTLRAALRACYKYADTVSQ